MLNMELYFRSINEKRQAAKIRHNLIEIIAITIIAVITVEAYGNQPHNLHEELERYAV